MQYTKKKLFIIADAGCDTGFANVTHNLVNNLFEKWEIHILGINYYGDPHPIQNKARLYNPSAKVQGDFYGTARVEELLHKIKPDVTFLINDPWVAASYVPLIKKSESAKVLYTPIDGANINEDFISPLNTIFDYIVGYTQYGIDQIQAGGFTGKTTVIPHGVDKKLYKPLDMKEARDKNGFPMDWFIINVTDRNQIRKRIDLAMFYFAQWVKVTNKPDTVKLHYHGAIQDEGWDILQLSRGLGIKDQFIITAPNITAANGLPLELMPYVYAPANVGWSTTMGEGWGLTTHERMAMRIPMIVPRYSALGEWANGGVHYTDISNIPYFNTKSLNTRGGISTLESNIEALEKMYNDATYRDTIAQKGYDLATSQKYSWRTVANQFDAVFRQAIIDHKDTTNGT